MNFFLHDLIPRIQRFSKKLDETTLLSNKHWVVIEEITQSKVVYIFRANNELLISQDGKVEKAKWEYLGNNSLLIDRQSESYMYKLGFFDENVLALKIDSKNEYAILINENQSEGELNTIENVIELLNKKYLTDKVQALELGRKDIALEDKRNKVRPVTYQTDKGEIVIYTSFHKYDNYNLNDLVTQHGSPAPDGKYRLFFMWYVHVKNGKIVDYSIL